MKILAIETSCDDTGIAILEIQKNGDFKVLSNIIASQIEGLEINQDTGRVLHMTENPSKIIATLVSEYEKILGKKVSFSFRKEKRWKVMKIKKLWRSNY